MHSIKTPKIRTGLQYLVLAASILFAVLIVGSLFMILHHSRFSSGFANQTGDTQRLSPLAIHTPVPPTPPASAQTQCKPNTGDYYVVCLHHQETVIHQQRHSGNLIITADGAYVDSNQLIVNYILALAPGQTVTDSQQMGPMVFSTATARQGIRIYSRGGGGGFPLTLTQSSEAQEVFGLGSVPTNITQLDLHLQSTLTSNGPVSRSYPSVTFDFSLPFHRGRIAKLNQTITVGGIPITLGQVVVTLTQTRIDLLNPNIIEGPVNPNSPPASGRYMLLAGDWSSLKWQPDATSLGGGGTLMSIPGDKHSTGIGMEILVDASLYNQQGQWQLTVPADAIAGGSGPWIFNFTVPVV